MLLEGEALQENSDFINAPGRKSRLSATTQRRTTYVGESFAERVEDKGWIYMPAQCKTGVETFPIHTTNKPENYPNDGLRDLHSMATMFGYSCAEDFDECNKNFVHRLFRAMKRQL